MSRNIGAIDIGTNSLHLMVAEVDDDGSFRVLTREKEPVRLGSGGGDMKVLSGDAIDRGITCLRRFRHIAEQWGAELSAMATSAVREATNRDVFVDRAEAEAGVEVDVISGTEEARLIHLGVLQAIPVGDRRHLVVDIGGGSTEFVVADRTEPLLLRSMKLGAIRLTDRFFPNGVVDDESLAACRYYVRGFLSSLAAEITEFAPTLAIASSGTAETLAALTGSGESLTAADLTTLTEQIVSMTPSQRRKKLGIEERRSDIIAAGAVLLDEITRATAVERWEISEHALRAGIVFDLIHRHRADDGLHRLTDLRRESVLTVAARYHEDIDHVEHITDLALELFDETVRVHGLGEDERDLLEAASLLHNIGLFVAHSAHHKHSYYLIRHVEQLAGFTDHDTELVAQIARYHRKSGPKEKHPEWAALDLDDRRRVELLAGVLRIAIGLDRSNRTVVQRIEVDVGDDGLAVMALTRRAADAELEIYSANARSALLAKAAGRSVQVLARVDPTLGSEHPSGHSLA